MPPAIDSIASSSWHMAQLLEGWRPDIPSLVIGLLLGAGLAFLFQRVLPLLRRLRDRSLNRVQETQAWVRAGVEKRFQAETAAYVRRSHLAKPWATLDQFFVEPRLLAPPVPADPSDDYGATSTDLIYLWPEEAAAVGLPPPPTVSLRQLLLNGQRVLISSPVGWGKSTLLAYCAHLCAEAEKNEAHSFLLPYIPVLLHLSELDFHREEAAEDPALPVASLLQQRAGPLTATGIGALFRQKLEQGDVLMLLDGWDEVPLDRQSRPLQWLTALLERYPDIKIVMATGQSGYEPLLHLEFTRSGLAPWRAHQALQLGKRWTELLQLSKPPHLDSYWQPYQSPLVTTLCLWQVSRGRAEVSGSLSALLERSLDLLLRQTKIEEGLYAAVLEFWQELAYLLLSQKTLSLQLTAVQNVASSVAARQQLTNSQSGVLRSSLETTGLFVQDVGRSLRLRSSLWRDYLVAVHLAQMEQPPPLTEQLNDPFWQRALRFYVARHGERGLANHLLDAGGADPFHEPLFALAAWLPEAREEGPWRRRALVQLGHLVVRPHIPDIVRQRALAVLAASGESGVMALLRQLLQHADANVRIIAVAAVARFEPEQCVPLLQDMLRDGDANVRAAAVHALGWQYCELSERPLLEVLIGRDDNMRRAVIQQLALNGGSHWQLLREAAQDEDLHVRHAAARGLQLLDTAWATKLLQKMEREDDEWIVKSAATLALEAQESRRQAATWQPLRAADLGWMVEWAAERDQAVPGGPAAVTMLCELLATAPEATTRVTAARALAHVLIPAERRDAVWASLHQAQKNDASGNVREAAFITMAHLYRARGKYKT